MGATLPRGARGVKRGDVASVAQDANRHTFSVRAAAASRPAF